MVEIKGKHLCENCFEECTTPYCAHCGYNPSAGINDPTMLAPGSILLGKYIVGKVMGKGGFGITYLAYDITADRKVAIKEYFPYGVALRAGISPTVSVSTMENAEAFKLGAEKFYDEAKLVSKFNGNPNIVGVYEFFYENDTVYFAMEYLKGKTLKEHISEYGVISAPQALFLAQNVSNALMAAHSANVLHRDISPDNIILCDDGSVKLIDFGAARQVLAEHSQSFSVILKPGFAPLEQYQKKGNQGSWSDIYALGTTLYFSLTEDIPEDPMSRLDEDSTFGENKFGVETEIWEIICKATQLKINDRYGDTFQLRNDLSKVTYKPEPIITPKAKPEEQMPEFRTAMPFGMAKAEKQPVTAGAPANAASAVYAAGQPQDSTASASASAAAPQKKKRPIGLIIGIAAGAFVLFGGIIAAVLVPTITGKTNKSPATSDVYNNSSISYQSGNSGSESLSDTPSQPQTPSEPQTPSQPYTPKVNIPSSKMNYALLLDEYKPLYEVIYDGLSKKSTSIAIPSGYNDQTNSIIYYYVLYDNPQFYYVNDYEKSGSNIVPHYIESIDGAGMEAWVMSLANLFKDTDSVKTLQSLHDYIAKNTALVERYTNSTCTSAYGALKDEISDDMGIAKAFCYIAQKMGFRCVVVDGTLNGKTRAWCRVEADGVWYNVDVYGDMTVASYVKEFDIKQDDVFRSFFLGNDTFFVASGYTVNSEYNDLVKTYPANSQYASYYIQKYQAVLDGHNNDRYYYCYYYTVDEAYNNLLSFSADRINAGGNGANWSVSPLIVDELWRRIKSNFFNDLSNKYGISKKSSWEYSSDVLSVTFS